LLDLVTVVGDSVHTNDATPRNSAMLGRVGVGVWMGFKHRTAIFSGKFW